MGTASSTSRVVVSLGAEGEVGEGGLGSSLVFHVLIMFEFGLLFYV